MIHPQTAIKKVSEQIGNGVFATDFIPKGTIVVVRDSFDIILGENVFKKLPDIMQRAMEGHMYRDCQGQMVLSWDHARYMNHNCQSNTLLSAYEIEIAVCDIHPGQEITSDYGLLNIEHPYEIFCNCHDCRKHLRCDDIDNYADKWDEAILESLMITPNISQPLMPVLNQGQVEKLQALFDGREEYLSVKILKYPK